MVPNFLFFAVDPNDTTVFAMGTRRTGKGDDQIRSRPASQVFGILEIKLQQFKTI